MFQFNNDDDDIPTAEVVSSDEEQPNRFIRRRDELKEQARETRDRRKKAVNDYLKADQEVITTVYNQTKDQLFGRQFNKDARWASLLGNSAGATTGLFIGILICWFFWGLLQPQCAVINGQVCNYPYGYCAEGNVCNCLSALVSGQYCEQFACRNGCKNGGICSPYMQSQFVYPPCRHINPTPLNNLQPSVTGWDNPTCINYQASLDYKVFVLGLTLTDEESATWPSCLCEAPWSGPSCENDLSPQDAARRICSDNGNKTINLYENNTIGLGAQCNSPFTLLDYSLNENMTSFIASTNPELLFKQFCGRLKYTNTSFYVESINCISCFCDEFSSGPACQASPCTLDEFGQACNGNGAPNVGIGLQYNTTIKRHKRCFPICAPGYQLCDDIVNNVVEKVCKKDCAMKQETCPPESPYRCRGLSCTDGRVTYQGTGEQGFNERVSPRNVTIDATIYSFYQLDVTSPLVAMKLPEGGGVRVSYYGTEYNKSFNVTERHLRVYQLPELVYVVKEDYIKVPSTITANEITVVNFNQERTLISLLKESEVTLLNYTTREAGDTYFVLNGSDLVNNIALLNDFSGVTSLDNCFINSAQCSFLWNGTDYLPSLPDNYVSLQQFTVARKYTVLYGKPLALTYPYGVIDEDATQEDRGDPAFIFLEQGLASNITIEYFLQEDLVLLDICSPYQDASIYFRNSNNQSYYNALWYSEYYREDVNFVTNEDYIVYYSFVSNSWERGLFIGNQTVRNTYKANITEPFITARRISKTEHDTIGLVECPSYLSFYKGKCVFPWLIENTLTTNCFCPNGNKELCTCLNGDRIVPEVFPSCSIYANGLYFPIRWIYTEGNYVNETARFNGEVFYDDNITEVFYGNFSNLTLHDSLNWTIGGYFPLGTLVNVNRTASSNQGQVYNTNASTNSYWEASSSDRNVFLNISSSSSLLTSLIVHIRNNTLLIGNVTIIIPIYVITSTGERYNITEINQELMVDVLYPSHWAALRSPYPFSVYEFSGFTNQECNTTSLINNITVWGIVNNTLNETLVNTALNSSCIYDDSCPQYNFTAMSYLNYSFTLVNYKLNKTKLVTNRDTCTLLHHCENGSCQDEECTTYYNCNGNGCFQPDDRSRFFKCACQQGWNGLDCNVNACKAITWDITIFDENRPDPHAFCACEGPPPIKEKPSQDALLFERNMGVARYLEKNRLGLLRNNVRDVRDIYIRPEFAPYGVALTRIAQTGTLKFVTTCPFARKGPSGQYLLLEDDVEERDANGYVTKWRTYYDYDLKKNVTPIWETEASFDDFPFRTANGRCVETKSYAINQDDICNGHGTCQADGTCLCSPGWVTFIFTDEITKNKRVPYYWDGRYNLTDPTIWGLRDLNWRDFSGEWCTARDCSVKDCSKDATKGCFTGTPPDFKDAHVLCKDGKSCAANVNDCLTGARTELIECSGNGWARKRDYRDEWYCECGFSETERNGFAGDVCSLYNCPEKLNREFSLYNKKTRSPYFNKHGERMRGKWLGYCGVHIGPSPDDFGDWQTCCPNIPFELCNKVPCVINGKTTCQLAETCIPKGGTPKVYPCNDKGTPRADGTCECNHNENDGTGYVPDPDIGEENNCYLKIQCPINPITNTPCGKVDACDDPKTWVAPISVDFFNQQVDLLLLKLKFSLSNNSVINQISNIVQIAQQKLQAYEAIAIATEQAIKDVARGIYVDNPNDTNYSFPLGMLPYTLEESLVILPYDKPFETPFLLPFIGYAMLQDSWVTSLEYSELGNGTDYTALPLSISFNKSNRVYAIRVHARSFNAANQTVRFLVNGLEVCPLVIIDSVEWKWVEQYCDPVYVDFNYQSLDDYQVKCILNKGPQEICNDFKRDNCPGKYLPPNELHAKPRGCFSECCILVLPGFSTEFLSNVSIVADNSTAIITVDQVQFYGYYNETVRPVPPRLFVEKNNCSESPDYPYAQRVLGDDKSFFLVNTSLNFTDANLECQLRGAWLASTISSVGLDDYDAGLAQEALKSGVPLALISATDTNRSQVPQNITEFFEDSCTKWGAYFEATAQLDMYAARNETIYMTQWVNSSQKTWQEVFTAFDSVRYFSNVNLNPFTIQSDYGGDGFQRYTYYDVYRLIGDCNVKFAFVLHYWQPPIYRIDFYSAQNFIWEKKVNTPDNVYSPNMRLQLFNTPSAQADYTSDSQTLRTITFQTMADIWNRVGVVDWGGGVQCNGGGASGTRRPINPGGCAATYFPFVTFPPTPGIPTKGYCADYLRDTFPFDFFGVELFSYLEATQIPGSKWHKFNIVDQTLRGNTKSIRMLPPINSQTEFSSAQLVITARMANGTIFYVRTTILPNTFYDLPRTTDVIIALQVYPSSAWLPLSKFRFGVRGEPYDTRSRPGYDEDTMGYLSRPYMGQRVFTQEVLRINYEEFHVNNGTPGFFKTYFLPGDYALYPRANATVNYITGKEVVKNPSTWVGNFSTFTLNDVLNKAIDTALLGRPIISAPLCEVRKRSDWQWMLHTYTRQGGFPKQLTVSKDSGIVIYGWPVNGTIRLDQMNITTNNWRGYVRQSVVHLIDDYLKPTLGFGKDWCVAINSDTGRYNPVPCDVPRPFICIYDYGPYIALPGRVGNKCGCSSRLGGLAQPGVTCIDSFPLANSTRFPFEHYILSLYKAGTLNLALELPYDYDGAREFYFKNDKPIVWAVTDAWDLWRADFSDCPGTSIAANPYDCLDFSLTRHYPYSCGAQLSQRTGEITHLCARDVSYCDPDAIYEDVELRYYPGVLSPVDIPSPKNILCAYSIRPSSYVIRDNYGGATPANLNVLPSSSLGYLTILASVGDTFVYNTGKPTYVFEGNLTYYGTIEFTEGTTGNFSIWVSPLSPDYLYPTTKITLYESNITNATMEYLFSYNILQNNTYQTIGFDISVLQESIISISNVLISNNVTLAKCSVGFLGQKRYEPPPSVRSKAPRNRCIFSKSDTVYYKKNKNVGECYCDHMFGGKDCACPAINNYPCGGPYGECYDGNKCRCLDMGSLFYQKLLIFGTKDYFKVYVQNTVYNEKAFVLLSNSSTLLTLTQAKAAALTAATTLPSFVNGDEADEFLALLPNVPVFVDLIRDNTDSMQWQERGIPFDWSSETLLLGEPIEGTGNWTSEIISAMNFDNLAFNTSNVLTDGNMVYFTNISSFTALLNTMNVVYVFSFNASCVTANCAKLNDVTTANAFVCSAGTVSFNVYNISEYQVYEVGTVSLYI
jgi:hypothetical protein